MTQILIDLRRSKTDKNTLRQPSKELQKDRLKSVLQGKEMAGRVVQKGQTKVRVTK